MIRAGWISPCVGVGGADAYMLGLIKYCHNIDWTAVTTFYDTNTRQHKWLRSLTNIKVYSEWKDGYHRHDDFIYNSFDTCCRKVYNESDVIITWCVESLGKLIGYEIDKPIIDLAQNSDDYARKVCASNESIVTHRVACSDHAKICFKNKESVTIYNAIDPTRCSPRLGRHLTRKLWNLEDKKIILFLGRFVEEKHPEKILAALQFLPSDWVAVFVGTGKLEKELLRQAQTYIDNKRVFFRSREYLIGDFFAAADVFCLPTDFEGHPLALCEAWMAGIPTVTTSIPPIMELQNKFGNLTTLVATTDTPEQLADALQFSITEDNLPIVNKARAITWENFTLPTAAAQWETYINKTYYEFNQNKISNVLDPVSNPVPYKRPV